MMGGHSSKPSSTDSVQPQPQLQPQTQTQPLTPLEYSKNSQYEIDLSSYETACKQDPSLQSFDAVLQERTNRVIGTLATGLEVRSLSFNSLKEMTDCLLEMNQEVVKVILENKKDIWNNQEMFSLVEMYFDNSIQTLDFCSALEKCLKRTMGNQLIIRAAVRKFEEETECGSSGSSSSFGKTLQELARFKEAGDPFTEEFFVLFQSVFKQQVTMLEKLQKRKRKLDKKLKSIKTWRKVSNVIFVATFVSVLIFTVVAAAIAAPPVVTALLGALAVPIGSVGKWCNVLWNRYGNAVKGQRALTSSMQVGTFVTLKDLENIRLLVNKLEIVIESLMVHAEFAFTQEDSLKIVIDEIKKKLEVFTETTESLTQQNEKCIQEITMARRVIIQRIIRQSSS
jgi:xanthosine utilization system XapX-like protein